jgi:hypothetical protein
MVKIPFDEKMGEICRKLSQAASPQIMLEVSGNRF